MTQATPALLNFDAKKRRTRRQIFLADMDKVVSWSALRALLKPAHSASRRGRRSPTTPSSMLRINFTPQWYALPDPETKDALYEIESTRWVASLESSEGAIPNETTILKFRRWWEQHGFATNIPAVNTSWDAQTAAACKHDCGCHLDRGFTFDNKLGEEGAIPR